MATGQERRKRSVAQDFMDLRQSPAPRGLGYVQGFIRVAETKRHLKAKRNAERADVAANTARLPTLDEPFGLHTLGEQDRNLMANMSWR